MDWRRQRTRSLEGVKRVVVKVGSAVLTGPRGLDREVVGGLADQLCGLHGRGLDVVLVSSGAVSAGRRVIGREIRGLPERQAVSAIGQSRLMHVYDELFGQRGVATAQLLLTRDGLMIRSRFLNVINTLRTLLDWRVVPIINENDTVAVDELVFGDNDCLASLLLNVVEADLFVNLTSARGVFAADPALDPQARPLNHIPDIADLDIAAMCGAKTSDGSGGMYSKLQAARRAAQLGVPTLILPGREPGCIARVFAGEDMGTWVLPEDKAISRRKFWLAYNNQPEGEVTVDRGAARALAERGKSLLPAGICKVDGDFGAGDLVLILDQDGNHLGVGLSNYCAADLSRIMGHHSNEIDELLGLHNAYPEAVHRDNMLMHAAV